MSGGGKLEVINTRERAVSQDINRLQAFLQYDRAEIWRRLLDMRTNAFGGGIEELGNFVDTNSQDAVAITSPTTADVIDGLVVLPQPGSLNLLVSPGCVFLNDPDGQTGSSDPNPPSPDDSRLKLVVDPGVALVGTLVLSPGAGSIRIDVIECQRTTVLIESDNRDIFDPSTGLFTATPVIKVIEAHLEYRIREGTPGAGFPGTVQGWLPLAVVSVPSAAPNVDTMTFWDVRPLVKDRFDGVGGSQRGNATLEGAQLILGDDLTDTSKTLLYGFSTSQIGMYRAGGLIAGVGVGFDIQDPVNQSTGYAPIAGFPWYLYALFPGGLPRWVKYAEFPVPRVPLGPLGIIVASNVSPSSVTGNALLTVINTPAATGLLLTSPAAMLAAGMCDATPKPGAIIMRDGLCSLVPGSYKAKAVASSTTTTDDYIFLSTIDFPINAKSILVQFDAEFDGAAFHYSTSLDIKKPATGTVLNSIQGTSGVGTVVSAVNQSLIMVVEIPIPPFEVVAGYANANLYVTMRWNQSTGTKSSPSAFILGFRI